MIYNNRAFSPSRGSFHTIKKWIKLTYLLVVTCLCCIHIFMNINDSESFKDIELSNSEDPLTYEMNFSHSVS